MNKRLITLSAIVGLAALSRLLPHPPNVTPIAAMALFAGAHFRNWRIAFLMPIAAMFLSDLVLGFAVYGAVLFKSQPVVYLCMIITVGIGRLIENKRSVAQVFTATLTSAVIFYVVTNFAVWAGDALYPKTLSGMITCYTAAIPFFRNSVLGDVGYTAILFAGFAMVENFFSSLRERKEHATI